MTDKRQKRRMWQIPWDYAESIAVVGGVIIVGLLLQCSIGQFDFYLLSFPANIYIGIAITVLSTIGGLTAHRNKVAMWVSSVPLSVCLMCALTLLSLIMGLVMQVEDSKTLFGLDVMTRNWAFVLIYFITLVSLGSLIVRRIKTFCWRDCAFYLNHIGLWILLFASGLGYADMQRYIMYVREGETEWRVFDKDNNEKVMPIAIQLNDFDMDVYPPKLAVIDRGTGDIMPHGTPEYFQIDTDEVNGEIDGWKIELKKYIHQAVRNSDSTYQEVPMPGSSPAALIVATKGNKKLTGWVCPGNIAQMYMTLPLSEKHSIVMTPPEPRSFTSNIEVYTEDGTTCQKILEVNSPLHVGAWTIYQTGYDNEAGRLSTYSSFELVYDPWLIPVYVGIIMMLHGMAIMIFIGSKKKKEATDDME